MGGVGAEASDLPEGEALAALVVEDAAAPPALLLPLRTAAPVEFSFGPEPGLLVLAAEDLRFLFAASASASAMQAPG